MYCICEMPPGNNPKSWYHLQKARGDRGIVWPPFYVMFESLKVITYCSVIVFSSVRSLRVTQKIINSDDFIVYKTELDEHDPELEALYGFAPLYFPTVPSISPIFTRLQFSKSRKLKRSLTATNGVVCLEFVREVSNMWNMKRVYWFWKRFLLKTSWLTLHSDPQFFFFNLSWWLTFQPSKYLFPKTSELN